MDGGLDRKLLPAAEIGSGRDGGCYSLAGMALELKWKSHHRENIMNVNQYHIVTFRCQNERRDIISITIDTIDSTILTITWWRNERRKQRRRKRCTLQCCCRSIVDPEKLLLIGWCSCPFIITIQVHSRPWFTVIALHQCRSIVGPEKLSLNHCRSRQIVTLGAFHQYRSIVGPEKFYRSIVL